MHIFFAVCEVFVFYQIKQNQKDKIIKQKTDLFHFPLPMLGWFLSMCPTISSSLGFD